MNIIVNDIAASTGGALTILKSFYDFVLNSEEAKKHQWFFLLSDNYINESDHISVIICKDKKNWIKKIKFDFFTGANFINKFEPDIVLSLQNTFTNNLDCPQIVYMHQSLPFQNVKRFSFFKFRERSLAVRQYIIGSIIKSSLVKADHIIVQTNWIKKAVSESIGINPGKITKIDMPEIEYSHNIEKEKFNKNSFFYPASKAIYKNHEIIIQATKILESDGYTDYVIIVTHDSVEENAHFVNKGIMKFDDVLKQYNRSTLIFPSFIETLGLPLLEAKQFGAIVLASNTPFAQEALDEYPNAYFFDPFKPNELANLMKMVLDENIVRNDYPAKIVDNKVNGWCQLLRILEKEAEEK